MSTSAQEFPSETMTVERRFYSRVVPHAPIYIAIDESEESLLLNVSENGLLVSVPSALQLNFVARIAVPLSGLPKPVQVNVRVVWTNEVTKQAGIQLLDLSEHDREQIRKWGTRESSQFLHRPSDSAGVAPVPSARPSATTAVTSSFTQSSFKQEIPTNTKPLAATSISGANAPDVSTSPAARIALWGMAIAALCLAALFFVKNNALGNSFAHSREILRRSSTSIPAPAQGTQTSPQNPDAARPYVSVNAAPPPPLADAAKSRPVPAGKSPLQNSSPSDRGANQPEDVASDEETSVNPGVDGAETQLDAVPAKSSTNGAHSRTTDATSRNSATPRSGAAPFNSSVSGGATSARPPVPPTTSVPNQPARNTISSNEIATRAPAPLPARLSNVPAAPSAARNVVAPVIQPVIQMDTPARQVMEIRLQRGSGGSFVNLPGERVLESSSATIHIQRSVRMPAAHSVWPFNRTKKVIIGGLVSRVDPQLAQAQISSADFIRVSATIDENGRVESVKPILGRANLVPAVLKAVQEWRYQPTLVDGKPVETKADVLIQFHGPPRYSARQ